jgi:AhpD family alkylhydroperoxidase
MQERVSRQEFYQLQPALPRALLAMHEAAKESVEPGLVHLIFFRVSQINGCAFCQHMHAAEARRDGERQERLDMLAGWREAPGFTERERAALAWAEAMTRVADGGIDDALHERTTALFGAKGVTDLTAIVLAINAWNRIAIANRFVPELSSSPAGG